MEFKRLSLLIFSILFITNIYSQKDIKIGNQIWTASNLNVSTFRNGDSIPEAKTIEEWETANQKKTPAWCYYNNDPTNGSIYGKLYNGFAVSDPRGLAPVDYHVPTKAEWEILISYLGEKKAGKKMKTDYDWHTIDDSLGTRLSKIKLSKGSNISGFSALPSGYRSGGNFHAIGIIGNWWSLTQESSFNAYYCSVAFDRDNSYVTYDFKESGFSVRCIKDN